MNKQFLYLATMICIIGLSTVSCKKESAINIQEACVENEFNAHKEFSIILSKALSENPELRIFLKQEALEQFDRDYDVLYLRSKNDLVDGKNTFAEVLSKYDDNGYLDRIEEDMPKLNILIPDWSWAEGFSINNWDTTNNDVSVGYVIDGAKLQLYNGGKEEFVMEFGQLSEFPIVIINTNERVEVLHNTKSSAPSFVFIDPEFDGSQIIRTKVDDHQYYDRIIETEDYSNFVSAAEMANGSTSSIDAYSLFKDNTSAVHRDYIYYGMTNDIVAGKLNVHINEYIAKFRLGSLDSEFLFDGDDFKNCPSSYTRFVSIPDETLIKKFCYEGNLELYFQICIGNANGTSTIITKYKTVSFADAFQLSKVHVDFKHKTLFTDRKWVFTVDAKCFVPKWIDANIQLPKWDISSQSTIMNIHVSEYDNETEETGTITVVKSFTSNFSTEAELAVTGTVDLKKIANANASGKVKIGYGSTSKEETTETLTTKVKKGSDDLGTALLYYTDPIVLSPDTLNGVDGYRVKEIETGFVYMLIIPRYE